MLDLEGSVKNFSFFICFEFKFPLNLVFQTRPVPDVYNRFPKKLRTQNFLNKADSNKFSQFFI